MDIFNITFISLLQFEYSLTVTYNIWNLSYLLDIFFNISEIQGYVKNAFRALRTKTQSNKFITLGIGSITDGRYKLGININNFNEDDEVYNKIFKGHYVSVKGVLFQKNDASQTPLMIVEKDSDIELMEKETKANAKFLFSV